VYVYAGVQDAQVDAEPTGSVSRRDTSALSRSARIARRPPATHQAHQLPALQTRVRLSPLESTRELILHTLKDCVVLSDSLLADLPLPTKLISYLLFRPEFD